MAAADRSRRLATWAAAVARAPIATPGTVPWDRARPWDPPGTQPGGATRWGPVPGSAAPDAAPGGARPGLGPDGTAGGRGGTSAGPGRSAAYGAERVGRGIGEVARRELGELVTAGREAVAERLAELGRPDPARTHARRVRRTTLKARLDAGVAFGFAAVTGVAVAASSPEAAEAGLGVVTVAAGWQAVRSGRRLRSLRRAPAPPARAVRAPKDSPARAPLDRLARQEQVLHQLLTHLGEAADEPRRVAASAAAGLRELGARLTAVDRAHQLSGALDAAVAGLREQLEAGLASYDALVVAAGDAVAADAGLRTYPRLEEATDALAGLAAGLRALTAGPPD
ncbi:MAG TPA: hypothetical protein VI357_16000 [Mycobacteriales bacterium]